MNPLTIALLLLATSLASLCIAGLIGFLRGGHQQSDRDVFKGTRRTVKDLPATFEVLPAHWRWQLLEVDEIDKALVYGLEVLAEDRATGAQRWLQVGQGIPDYVSDSHAPPDLPGSWAQDMRRVPMDPERRPVDAGGALATCRILYPPRMRGFRV